MTTTSRRPPFEEWFGTDTADATYGHDLPDLLAVEPVPAPPGFDAFWRDLAARAREVDPSPVLTPIGRTGVHELHAVRFRTTDGLTLGGWLALPVAGSPELGLVVSHGYGGRMAPDLAGVPADAAALFPVARGLPAASLIDGVPAVGAEHVLVGIGSVATYILGGCAADLWCAATALTRLAGDLPLYFHGASFGGGQGALALPWDDRFFGATLVVPSFGQHDLRLRMPCTGSGESVRHHVAAHPEAREVLRFFDASTSATRITVPTRVEAALWDPAVPPPGQFAVHNGLAGPKELYVRSAGHTEYPGQDREDAECVAGTLAHIATHRR
ncbi:acetylesterase [Occultella glacieicola]|uniref:Acetylesterase n=1 Tax=Occultella glacieicola TaxID=2518684 RepID=A0ABY2E8Y1_9MICO|nr:acetylxylan esterase [Occultella glacieicola]TDE98959.1 acetylesterase [Occultella glacieicola]